MFVRTHKEMMIIVYDCVVLPALSDQQRTLYVAHKVFVLLNVCDNHGKFYNATMNANHTLRHTCLEALFLLFEM